MLDKSDLKPQEIVTFLQNQTDHKPIGTFVSYVKRNQGIEGNNY